MPGPADNQENQPRKQEEIEAELQELAQTRQELQKTWQSQNSSNDGDNNDELAAREAADLAREEDLASQKGWVPKDKYRGDPEKWVDAKTFNQRGERFVKNLEREVAALRQKVSEFEGTKKQLQKVFSETIKAKDNELQSALATLRSQKLEAQRDGDDDLTIQLEDRIEAVREQRAGLKKELEQAESAATGSEQGDESAEPRGPNAADPMLREWIEDGNEWFENDPKLRSYALALGEDLIKGGFKQKGRPFLEKITEEMKVQFPTTFRKMEEARNKGNGQRNNPTDGGGSSSAGKRSGGKTERDLPPEDFAIMEELISEGSITKEAFLKSYFSRNG